MQREKTPVACTLKHYGFVMYEFRSKLMCLSKPVEKTYNSNKTPAYSEVCLFTVHYDSVMLYVKAASGLCFTAVIKCENLQL